MRWLFVLLFLATPVKADPQSVADRIWAAAGQNSSSPRVIVSPHVLIATIENGTILISEGLSRYSDESIAFIIAHEAAHLILGHGPSTDLLLRTKHEIDADQLGFALALKAGFDRNTMLLTILRFGRLNDTSVYCPWTARAILLAK